MTRRPLRHKGVDIILDKQELTMGRMDGNHVLLASANTSKHHARLTQTAKGYVLEVSTAFWRAIMARTLLTEAEDLYRQSEERRRETRDQIRQGNISKMVGLERCKRLMNIQMRYRGFSQKLNTARAELANLMGIAPGTKFRLARNDLPPLEHISNNAEATLEEEALTNRPELFQQDYEEKISSDNTRMALLKLLPNPMISLRRQWDDNPFLYYKYWYTAGLKLSTDLLSMPRKTKELRVARMNTELIRKKRTALALAILTQTRIALIQYREAKKQVRAAERYKKLQEEILDTLRGEVKHGRKEPSEILETRAECLTSKVLHLQSYIDALIARAKLENSVGREPLTRIHARREVYPVRLGPGKPGVKFVVEPVIAQGEPSPLIAISNLYPASAIGTSSPVSLNTHRNSGVNKGNLYRWEEFDDLSTASLGWRVIRSGNPARLYIAQGQDGSAALGLNLFAGNRQKVMAWQPVVPRHRYDLNLAYRKSVLVDILNLDNQGMHVSLLVGGRDRNGKSSFGESRKVWLKPGLNRHVRFPLQGNWFKPLRAQRAGYRQLENAGNCDKIGFSFFNGQRNARIIIDNIWLEQESSR